MVEAAVRELDAAGCQWTTSPPPVSANGNTAPPVDRLLERLDNLASVYDTTSAAQIRPRSTSMVAPSSAISQGMTDSSGMVLFKAESMTTSAMISQGRRRRHREAAGVAETEAAGSRPCWD